MKIPTFQRWRPSPAGVAGCFVLVAIVALALGDLHISASDPWAEFQRLFGGLLTPDLSSFDGLALLRTVAFAVLGVGIGGSVGFLLAIVFPRSMAVRWTCAALRSVHELFWALLLMQVMGLGPATGILAIALPYAGIFAKVFSEMIEEADLSALQVLPHGSGAISTFFYAKLPLLAPPFANYTLYRLECGMRSTLVLGFIGLPTVGFDLDSYFRQGYYSHAATLLFCFYGLIATRRLWARPIFVPFLVAGSIAVLPQGLAGGDVIANLTRFVTHDIVPAPLRSSGLSVSSLSAFGDWIGTLIFAKVLPGAFNTLVVSQMALVATAILAMVLFPFSSRCFAGRYGRPLGRAVLLLARSTPDYMIAFVLLQTLGPSMLPAVIALTLHNAGVIAYLMGRQADELALRADAPRGLNLYFYEVLPRLFGQFLAYCLYRWEIILRESAIFGILGVRTLGYYVDASLSELRLDEALALVVATALLSILIDAFSRGLRARLKLTNLPVRLSAEQRAVTAGTVAG